MNILVARLRAAAQSESEASRMIAEAKSKRQADNPTGECVYAWIKPENTLSWKAADAIEAGEKFLDACNSAWAAGEPEHRVKTMLDLSDEFRAKLYVV